MTRLVVFVCFVLCLLVTLGLLSYQKLSPEQTSSFSSTPFDFQKQKASHLETLALIAKSAQHHSSGSDQQEGPMEDAADTQKKPPIDLSTPELQLGYDTYAKMKCQTCHGNFGEGKKSQLAPRIASQYDWYLEAQIAAVRDGSRINGKMLPYVKKITDADIKNIAYFLSRIPD